MRLSLPLTVPVILSAFACGLLVSRASPREAHAQSNALASTIYVPSDGLAFRTFDGHVIAKLSYDSHGGILEVFDEHERTATALRADALGATRASVTPASAPASTGGGRPDLGF